VTHRQRARLGSLEDQVSALANADQPISINVDCGAGQTVAAALAQAGLRPGPVDIVVTGFCPEEVAVGRDRTSVRGASPGDGLKGISLNGPYTLWVDHLSLVGGSLTIANGAYVGANAFTATGAPYAGLSVTGGAVANLTEATFSDCSPCIAVEDSGHVQIVNGVVEGRSGGSGFSVVNNSTVWLSGLSVRGASIGLSVAGGSSLFLRDSTVEQKRSCQEVCKRDQAAAFRLTVSFVSLVSSSGFAPSR
jgi:hypothetical protein